MMAAYDLDDPMEFLRASHEERKEEINHRYKARRKEIALWFFGFVVVTLVGQWYFTRQAQAEAQEPQPALVTIDIEKPESVQVLCPGETLTYSATIDIDEPNVGMAFVNVRNVSTKRIEIASATPRIDDEVGVIEIQTDWQIPEMLPAIGVRPERPWTAGLYKRVLAITSEEGDRDAEPESILFIISAQCPGVLPG